MSETDARSEVISDSVRGVSHRFSWYYQYCWPACALFLSNLILLITGNRICIGKICFSKNIIFLNVPWGATFT